MNKDDSKWDLQDLWQRWYTFSLWEMTRMANSKTMVQFPLAGPLQCHLQDGILCVDCRSCFLQTQANIKWDANMSFSLQIQKYCWMVLHHRYLSLLTWVKSKTGNYNLTVSYEEIWSSAHRQGGGESFLSREMNPSFRCVMMRGNQSRFVCWVVQTEMPW